MTNSEILQEYSDSIKRLRRQCLNSGMSEEEFKILYMDSLNSIENETRNKIPKQRSIICSKRFAVIALLLVAYIYYNFKSIYSCLICNVQDFIYPGLKLLRQISIPFISLFPSLTDFYHETCLINNPFFTVVDMDCWPCSSVSNVRHVYDPKPVEQQNAPFIYETDQQVITIDNLKQIYTTNKELFDGENSKVLLNNKNYINPDSLFENIKQIEDKNLYLWKFNNFNMARLWRQVIPRPKVVPKFGQSTERFIIIDSSQTSFQVPDTECNFSFLLSLNGKRQINLLPSEECKHQCKVLKVELKESHLLWYNWWYWRPVVQPSNGNTTLIAHVGSYC